MYAFDSLNFCFQFGGERFALAESSSPRCVWLGDGNSRFWGVFNCLLRWCISCIGTPKCAARWSVMIGLSWLLTRSG